MLVDHNEVVSRLPGIVLRWFAQQKPGLRFPLACRNVVVVVVVIVVVVVVVVVVKLDFHSYLLLTSKYNLF